jgi:hypothetical protein
MTAFGAAAKVQPPCARCEALDATGAAGLRVQIYSLSLALHDFSSSRIILAMKACFSLGLISELKAARLLTARRYE